MTVTETEILVNQLQGIMDCSDMINISYLLKNQKLWCIHKQRLRFMMDMYHRTQQMMIDKYNEIEPVESQFDRIGGTIDTILGAMINKWITWNTVAIKLYSEEDGQWWKYLQRVHEKDLKLARDCAIQCKVTLPQSTQKKLNVEKIA